MIIKQIYNTENKSNLTITLPENFRKKRRVLVVLDDSVDTKSEKLKLMALASKDPIYIADIEETVADFKNIDPEHL